MAENFSSQLLHPRDRVPQIAPRINLEPGRLWVSVEEFSGRIQEISCELERIQSFVTFAKNNYEKVIQRGLIHGDIKIFTEMLSIFLEKEFINPKKMFETVCRKYQLEFLLLHNLSRK